MTKVYDYQFFIFLSFFPADHCFTGLLHDEFVRVAVATLLFVRIFATNHCKWQLSAAIDFPGLQKLIITTQSL